MPETAYIMPTKGTKKGCLEKSAIAADAPPSAKEPVSPIKIEALFVLKSKKASNPPVKERSKSKSDLSPSPVNTDKTMTTA